ncbi:MAG: hypothetical protein ACM3NQ_01675 [Bacteroidales bacterium]
MAHRLLAARVFFVALLVYASTAGGSLATTDAVVSFDVTRSICEHGSLAMSGNLLGMDAHRGVDGRFYSPFGIAQSIYNIPFYLAGRTAQRALGVRFGKSDTVTKAAVAMGGTPVAAACVALTFLLALEVSGQAVVALTAALLLGFGTVFWPYAKFGFNAPLATCFMLLSALGAWSAARSARLVPAALAGLALGGAMLTRHELAIGGLPIAIFFVMRARGSRAFALQAAAGLGGFGIGAAAWMAVNAVRFGNALNPGYLGDPIPAFGSSLFAGLYGLLLSPAASLIVYCPVVLLVAPALVWMWRRERPAAVLFGGIFLTMLVFYAQLGNWVGGRSYGPRYLVPTLPFLVIPVAWWLCGVRRRRLPSLAIAICALSVAVQLPGVLVDFAKVSVAWARQYEAGAVPDRRVEWRAAPLVLNTRATVEAVPRNVRYLAGIDTPPRPARDAGDADRDFSQQFAFSLDLWWLYLFYLGAWSAPVALLVGCVPLVAAVLISRQLARGVSCS